MKLGFISLFMDEAVGEFSSVETSCYSDSEGCDCYSCYSCNKCSYE